MSTIRQSPAYAKATAGKAEQAGAQAPAEAPKLRKFRVLYAVTRGECYEIDAPDEATAFAEAFEEGHFVETGDTTDVVECDVEEVLP
ncbi:MAG: hypothetical protein ACLP7P_09715 [Rhodomicrobium sp.]